MFKEFKVIKLISFNFKVETKLHTFCFQIYVYFSFLERNILYPLLFLSVLTEDSPRIVTKYGTLRGSFIVVICGIKCLRSSYSNQSSQYLILVFSALCFKYDYRNMDETFLVIYFFMITVFNKMYELLLKVSINFQFYKNIRYILI